MKKQDFILAKHFHDLTMLVLQNSKFINSNGNIRNLAEEISTKYLEVYNLLMEKYVRQEDRTTTEYMQGIANLKAPSFRS